jgi:glycosyltransferase involved in cell wall biosynthesis
VRDADVVILRRKAVPLFPYTRVSVEHLYLRLNPRMVVDVDDALHLPPAAPPGSRFGRLVDPDHFLRVVEDAAGVLAGSETLAGIYASRARRLLVLPTCVEVEATKVRGGGTPVIGWVGNPGGLDRLEELGPALARLADRHPYRLRVVSSRGIDLPDVAVELAPWSYEREGSLIAAFDVSLNPLEDTEFDRGRCALKVLLSMARGVAVVASPVGANAEIVRDGENGLLASTEAGWEDALARLLADPGLRRRLGAAGRRTVARRYTFAANAPGLVRFLAEVAW